MRQKGFFLFEFLPGSCIVTVVLHALCQRAGFFSLHPSFVIFVDFIRFSSLWELGFVIQCSVRGLASVIQRLLAHCRRAALTEKP